MGKGGSVIENYSDLRGAVCAIALRIKRSVEVNRVRVLVQARGNWMEKWVTLLRGRRETCVGAYSYVVLRPAYAVARLNKYVFFGVRARLQRCNVAFTFCNACAAAIDRVALPIARGILSHLLAPGRVRAQEEA